MTSKSVMVLVGKKILRRRIKFNSHKRTLPYHPSRYFTKSGNATNISLSNVVLSRSRSIGIINSNNYMRLAYDKKFTKRLPIQFAKMGVYALVIDGNSTVTCAIAACWRHIPAVMERRGFTEMEN